MGSTGSGKVLVTGAGGFIGSRLVQELCARGRAVRAAVRDPGRAALPAGTEIFRCDLAVPESLGGIEEGVDTVFHCAGLLGRWGVSEQELHRVNVDGVVQLMDRFRGRSLARFVHLSAGGVTGPLPAGPADEEYPCAPATAYERTKLAGERAVLDRSRREGFPVVVVRPTFTYGPGDMHKRALFRAVRRGRFAFVGRNASLIHPVYIDDLVAGILLAAGRGRPGEVYILGGPRPVTKRELVYSIADAAGVRRPRLAVPRQAAWWAARLAEALGRRLGFEPVLTRSRVSMLADGFGYVIGKAVRELGYSPRVELPEGIGWTVDDYQRRGLL